MEKTTPIRLISGTVYADSRMQGSDEIISGLLLTYENDDGSVDFLSVLTGSDSLKTVKFVDDPEESCILWEEVTEGIIFKEDVWRPKKIMIRRDWQSK